MGADTFATNVLQAATEILLAQSQPCHRRHVMQVLHRCISRESERQPKVPLYLIGYMEILEALEDINRTPRSSR